MYKQERKKGVNSREEKVYKQERKKGVNRREEVKKKFKPIHVDTIRLC